MHTHLALPGPQARPGFTCTVVMKAASAEAPSRERLMPTTSRTPSPGFLFFLCLFGDGTPSRPPSELPPSLPPSRPHSVAAHPSPNTAAHSRASSACGAHRLLGAALGAAVLLGAAPRAVPRESGGHG